jgi:hypothetical protein
LKIELFREARTELLNSAIHFHVSGWRAIA